MMHQRAGIKDVFEPAGYASIEVKGLDGQFCGLCGEGFWSLKSERKIAKELSEHMAKQDSTRIVAADIASVQEAAKAMKVTQQGVHKMMREGRLRYVFAAGHRLPIRKYLKQKSNISAHATRRPA
jgi:YgiT-type zinc finger domain-containing protein